MDEEEGEQRLLWKSETSASYSNSMASLSVMIGRVITTLLNARSKKLYDAVSRFSSHLKATPSLGSLEESLWFLHKYVKDAAEKEESLDEILIPMLENSLKSKHVKKSHGGQSMILLDWLFQDELLFQYIAGNLVEMVLTKEDRFITLGWCTFVRGVLEHERAMNQYPMNGIKQRYIDLLKRVCSCIPHLLSLVGKGSMLQGEFELPSRLSVSAADCLLAITVSLVRKDAVTSNGHKSSASSASKQRVALVTTASAGKKATSAHKPVELSNSETETLLWSHLEALIHLVQKLLAWSNKSRPLHSKGLEQVLKWLQELKKYYVLQVETDSRITRSGILLLSSCWKHYGVLIYLEDQNVSHNYRELLEQFLSGLKVISSFLFCFGDPNSNFVNDNFKLLIPENYMQFYMESHRGGHYDSKDGGLPTIKFFLNCLCLLLGRFDDKNLRNVVSEYGMQISNALLPQLHCTDEDAIDSVIAVLKAIVLKQHCLGGSLIDTRQTDAIILSLLHLLDEQDGTSRAVVVLIAEYCIMSSDGCCLREVLKQLCSGIVQERRNALDVLSELIHLSSKSHSAFSQLLWQDIRDHLLGCLADEEMLVREQASNLLQWIDPSLVLPKLVNLVCLSDELQSSSSVALSNVLKYHNQNAEVICMLLDCLRDLNQSADLQKTIGGSSLEIDRVLKLIPEWSKSVRNWKFLLGPLIEKMFVEPSNAILVRFLSHINKHLAEDSDIVLYHILLHTKGQKVVDASTFCRWESRTCTSQDSENIHQVLFEHLCPLLIIKMLPLNVFNDLNSSVMYGQLFLEDTIQDHGYLDLFHHECVASVLLKRAFYKYEFEDVRKLAAELCGRIHPQVLIPTVCSQLEFAADSQNILTIKTCLFSLCTSLVARGRNTLSHPLMLKIRKTLETVLLWPSLDGDEVSKAQHGCIDCLALMICAELQDPESCEASLEKIFISEDAASGTSVLSYVIDQLACYENGHVSTSQSDGEICAPVGPALLPFHLCLANVLISACQKISDSGMKPLAQITIPHLIRSLEVILQSEIRAAIIQILFSTVYHLKAAVLPHASNLLKISLNALQKGSEQERMAGAKLMASLMASEEMVLETISVGLIEARSVLSNVSLKDPSMELRQICQKLLACVTYP